MLIILITSYFNLVYPLNEIYEGKYYTILNNDQDAYNDPSPLDPPHSTPSLALTPNLNLTEKFPPTGTDINKEVFL